MQRLSKNFLTLTKDCTVGKNCKLLESYIVIFQEFTDCSRILIETLSMYTPALCLCNLSDELKRKLLKDLPLPYVLAMLDVFAKSKANLKLADMEKEQKELHRILTASNRQYK